MREGLTAATSTPDPPDDDVAPDPSVAPLRAVELHAAATLLDRGDLLRTLDRAVDKRVTVISAPAGSGKTSLLRAWAERSTGARRVALVSVERDQHNGERFWGAVMD